MRPTSGYAVLASLQSLLSTHQSDTPHCDTVKSGYQCHPRLSHFWGQYSPYFAVDSEIPNDIPSDCEITFAQVLSRHGARDPTAYRSDFLNRTIQEIQANVTTFSDKYAFLANYTYTLGAEQLTSFGEQELMNSGIEFARRYKQLSRATRPFVRAGSQQRVVESAQHWIQGYQKEADNVAPELPILIISEDADSNNTLNYNGRCTNFHQGWISRIAGEAQLEFAKTFLPSIQHRLVEELPGVSLTWFQTIALMDLCPFETVTSPSGNTISPFCRLFTEKEWHSYNYFQTLNKFYGNGNGNPLGPTQGVGFVNELLARMTNSPVMDDTSSNHTLDDDPDTFPLHRKLYADFSHDNDMTGVLSALGLYNRTTQLSNGTILEADGEDAQGFSAAWLVPFAARAYFEKMTCRGKSEELVRIIVNGRVIPLIGCGADDRGMCTLSNFVESQGFARANGHWDRCFS